MIVLGDVRIMLLPLSPAAATHTAANRALPARGTPLPALAATVAVGLGVAAVLHAAEGGRLARRLAGWFNRRARGHAGLHAADL